MSSIFSRSQVVWFSISMFCIAGFLAVQFVSAATTGTIIPRADGNYLQWTPKTGTAHYVMVDETPCNGTSDYNSTTVVGNRDSYVVSTSSIPHGATITQIDIKPCASRNNSGGGTSVMNVFYRFGGINSADAGGYAFTTGNTPSEQATTTFSGLSLLQTSTTTLETGAVYTSGTKGLRLSRIATFVTYTSLLAPVSVSGTATTSSAISVSWSAASTTNEAGFDIERSTNAVTWTLVASTSVDSSSYYDTGLAPGTGYVYRVRSYNFGGQSAFIKSATTTTANDSPPNDPSNLSATASTTVRAIALAWSDNSGNETNFEILRSLDGSIFAHLATTSVNAVSYTNLNLATTTTYYYQVRAYNTGGYSGLSNTASTTTI